MQNINKASIFITLVVIIFLGSCQKYEDGPCISFRSAYESMYGTYQIASYSVNGVDSLTLYKVSLTSRFYFYDDEVNSVNILEISGKRNDGKTTFMMCRWGLADKARIFKIGRSLGISNCIGTGPLGDKKLQNGKFFV